MATVLVAVLMLAGSIWIAIRMEAGLDRPVTRPGDPVRGLRSCELRCVRVTVGHAYPVRPARCRLHHGAANHGKERDSELRGRGPGGDSPGAMF